MPGFLEIIRPHGRSDATQVNIAVLGTAAMPAVGAGKPAARFDGVHRGPRKRSSADGPSNVTLLYAVLAEPVKSSTVEGYACFSSTRT